MNSGDQGEGLSAREWKAAEASSCRHQATNGVFSPYSYAQAIVASSSSAFLGSFEYRNLDPDKKCKLLF